MKKKLWVFAVMIVILGIISAFVFAGYAEKKDRVQAANGTAFSDVGQTDWFYSDVDYVNENGFMQGTSDTLFSPNEPTTRGMLVTILWRLDGKPNEYADVFSDVTSNSYYYEAVAWASKNGIVNGYSNMIFDPNNNITREQLAAILYRYSEYKKYDISKTSQLSEYTDKNQISDYALPGMRWACANGIITGMSADALSPQGNALRCQIAAILKRFCTSIITQNSSHEERSEQPEAATPNEEAEFSENKGGSISASKNSNGLSETGDNDGYPLLTVDSVSAKAGDEILLNVTLKNNPGILGMTLAVHFDENVCTLQGAEDGEAFQGVLDFTPSKVIGTGARFVWDGIEILEKDIKDGSVLVMKFKINDNAPEGRYPITLKYSDGDIVDNNLTSIFPQIEAGYITIIQ